MGIKLNILALPKKEMRVRDDNAFDYFRCTWNKHKINNQQTTYRPAYYHTSKKSYFSLFFLSDKMMIEEAVCC